MRALIEDHVLLVLVALVAVLLAYVVLSLAGPFGSASIRLEDAILALVGALAGVVQRQH